jgi:hypothetical protein
LETKIVVVNPLNFLFALIRACNVSCTIKSTRSLHLYFILTDEILRKDFTVKKILKFVWEKWKKVAIVIGSFNIRLLLTIFYFTLVIPFALIVKLFQDVLRLKPKKTNWINNFSTVKTPEDLKRQF